jgi:hypothetical protein
MIWAIKLKAKVAQHRSLLVTVPASCSRASGSNICRQTPRLTFHRLWLRISDGILLFFLQDQCQNTIQSGHDHCLLISTQVNHSLIAVSVVRDIAYWDTTLQTKWSRVRCPMSLKFFFTIFLILFPATLFLWVHSASNRNGYQESSWE